MNSLKILIVEDDISFAIELEMLIQNMGYQALDTVDNAGEALEIITQQRPDLILMDIDIKGRMSGIEVAEHIQHLSIPILFISSYSEQNWHQRYQSLNALGFIAKPVKKISLRSAIALAIRTIQAEQMKAQTTTAFSTTEEIFLKKKGIFYKVLIQDILYIQASDNHVMIYTDNDKFIAQTRLSDMQELVQGHHFFKVHRSYLINLKKTTILHLSENKIFIQKHAIPISRSTKAALMKQLNLIR